MSGFCKQQGIVTEHAALRGVFLQKSVSLVSERADFLVAVPLLEGSTMFPSSACAVAAVLWQPPPHGHSVLMDLLIDLLIDLWIY